MRDFSIDLIWAKIQIALTAIGGWLGYFVGGLDGMLIALLVFMVLDYLTGLMVAIVEKKVSSAIGFRGLFKKVVILFLVGVGALLDRNVVGSGSALRTAIIFFYLSNEGVTLLENATQLGLPVPMKLKDILAQLHNRAEKEQDDETDLTDETKEEETDA